LHCQALTLGYPATIFLNTYYHFTEMSGEQPSGELNAYLSAMQEQIRQLKLTVDGQAHRLATSTSVDSDRPKFKPIRPDTYSGRQDKTNVEIWLFHLRQYLRHARLQKSIKFLLLHPYFETMLPSGGEAMSRMLIVILLN